jgi:hypothetical protein
MRGSMRLLDTRILHRRVVVPDVTYGSEPISDMIQRLCPSLCPALTSFWDAAVAGRREPTMASVRTCVARMHPSLPWMIAGREM